MVEIEEISSDEDESQQNDGLRERKPKKNKKIDLSLDHTESLTKEILVEGTGEPVGDGKMVSVHYTGRFENGAVFDSSISRGQPLQVVIGKRNVILGWDIGIASMKKGEKAILTCSPDYAYGSSGVGPIPPFATLKFEVELLDYADATDESYSFLTIAGSVIACGYLLWNLVGSRL